MLRIAIVAAALLPVLAAPAAAALRWEAPRTLGDGLDGPQVAVNSRGAVVASWFAGGLKARIAIAERARAPGRGQLLDPRGRPIAPAISRTGRAVAAWSRPREVRVAFRRAGASRFGSARRIGRLRDDGVLADVFATIDDTGAGVVVWSDFVRLGGGRTEDRLSLRAFDASGRFGPEVRLGTGDLARPAADSATGRVAVAWGDYDGAVRVVERPGRDAPFAAPVQLADKGGADVSVALGPGGALAVGWTTITTGGDAGFRGHPTIRVRHAAGAAGFAPEVRVPTGGHANRYFRPQVAFMRATPQLVYQRKARIAGFSVIAPIEIRALTGDAFGAARVLERQRGQYLSALPLPGGLLLTMWTAPRRWAATIDDRRVSVPPANVPLYPTAPGNREIATAGRHVAAVWLEGDENASVEGGRIRLARGRLE